MGAPILAILEETFIQHMEHEYIYPIQFNRYVDDILIIYDKNETNIEQTLNVFSSMQPSIKFIIEKKTTR
jgi:hypothetical protein